MRGYHPFAIDLQSIVFNTFLDLHEKSKNPFDSRVLKYKISNNLQELINDFSKDVLDTSLGFIFAAKLFQLIIKSINQYRL